MPVRLTMASLITRTRRLIADPAGASQVWTDQEVQDALDLRRTDVRYLELAAAGFVQPGGAVVYLDFYAPQGDWEEDAVLYGPGATSYAVLSPGTIDYLVGRWTFAANQNPPVYLIGKTFDLYGAAAELLEEWAGKVKLQYDFSSNDQRFARSQQGRALLDLAALYRRKARPLSIPQTRGDA